VLEGEIAIGGMHDERGAQVRLGTFRIAGVLPRYAEPHPVSGLSARIAESSGQPHCPLEVGHRRGRLAQLAQADAPRRRGAGAR
jgi:hypothetical protein